MGMPNNGAKEYSGCKEKIKIDSSIVAIPIPPTILSESEEFLGIRYVTAGTDPTITCSAFLQPMSMIDATNDYASGYTIT